MSKQRTPEQEAAEKALDEAVEAVVRAYETEGLVVDYVLMVASQEALPNGDSRTSYDWWTQQDDTPIHRTLGIIDTLTTLIKGALVRGGED